MYCTDPLHHTLQIKEAQISRHHVRLTPDKLGTTVLVEQLGANPSAIAGGLIQKPGGAGPSTSRLAVGATICL